MAELGVMMETSKGFINIKLFTDETPFTCGNFANLAERKFYNGLKFFRVIPGFIAQGGCPYGNGTGGPGYQLSDEFSKGLKHDKVGILSMANSGPTTSGSQFFITHGPTPHLDDKYTVFGVVAGKEDQNVLKNIAQGDSIKEIKVIGDTEPLFKKIKPRLDHWNKIINKLFPDLQNA